MSWQNLTAHWRLFQLSWEMTPLFNSSTPASFTTSSSTLCPYLSLPSWPTAWSSPCVSSTSGVNMWPLTSLAQAIDAASHFFVYSVCNKQFTQKLKRRWRRLASRSNVAPNESLLDDVASRAKTDPPMLARDIGQDVEPSSPANANTVAWHDIAVKTMTSQSAIKLGQNFDRLVRFSFDFALLRLTTTPHNTQRPTTVSQYKTCHFYFLNNSMQHWPIMTIFRKQHREETWRKRVYFSPSNLNTVATLPCKMKNSVWL